MTQLVWELSEEVRNLLGCVQFPPNNPRVLDISITFPFDEKVGPSPANTRVQDRLDLKVLLAIDEDWRRRRRRDATGERVFRSRKQLDDWKDGVQATIETRELEAISTFAYSSLNLNWSFSQWAEFS